MLIRLRNESSVTWKLETVWQSSCYFQNVFEVDHEHRNDWIIIGMMQMILTGQVSISVLL